MCNSENYSCFVALLLAIILGFLVGFLVFFGLFSNITIGLIISIISAFIILIALFVGIIIPMYNTCIRNYSCGILIGIIGTIFFATISLSRTIGADISSAILVGLVVFFLTYLLIKFLKFLNCIIDINENNLEFNNRVEEDRLNFHSINNAEVEEINSKVEKEDYLLSNGNNLSSYGKTRYCTGRNCIR